MAVGFFAPEDDERLNGSYHTTVVVTTNSATQTPLQSPVSREYLVQAFCEALHRCSLSGKSLLGIVLWFLWIMLCEHKQMPVVFKLFDNVTVFWRKFSGHFPRKFSFEIFSLKNFSFQKWNLKETKQWFLLHKTDLSNSASTEGWIKRRWKISKKEHDTKRNILKIHLLELPTKTTLIQSLVWKFNPTIFISIS